jgi:prevent-host-death family protein
MFQVNDNTLVVAVSELRTKGPEVLERVKNGTVIVTRNNQPVGVIIDHDKYREMEKAFELLEDLVLGTIAQKREKEAKGKKLISHDNMPW